MVKKFKKLSALTLLIMLLFAALPAYAQDVADRPTDCAGPEFEKPLNCVFLREPIGGEIGYDLFVRTCSTNEEGDTTCRYDLWRGEAINSTSGVTKEGPFQAILSYEPDKEFQGPFGLLYNYIGLIYNYMSGVIVAVVVLFIVIGGIQMTTSAGDQQAFESGKNRILHALVGMVIWFLASLILYTINPTFFAF